VVVGCGRIVGGDGINFYIQDLIIRPEYQHRGMGTQIMKKLMDYIGRHAQIGLMAAEGLGACSRIENLLRKSPFGPLSRSFPLNRACYWPQMIKKMDSKWLPLATASILGQAPRGFLHALWFHPFS
jgi:GNAT superfamily N-acetyltransferase